MEKKKNRIICLNAQGFIKHKDKIENELIGKLRPNVLGFTKTHITRMLKNHEIQIDGYVGVRGDSESNRTGGVLLYVDKRIKFEVMAMDICERNWWTITVKIINKNYKGTVMLVYHSPNSSDTSFIVFLEETCNSHILNGNVIIMRDFNIDMKVNSYCKNRLIRVMNTVGLKQVVNEPTRIVNTSETIIDFIFTNTEVEVEVNHEPKITDHSNVVMYWDVKAIENGNRTIMYRNYKRLNMDEFRRLVDTNLNAIESNNANDLANLAVHVIIKCLDVVAPKQRIKIKDKWKGRQWFSEEIRQSIRQRDEACKTARISRVMLIASGFVG